MALLGFERRGRGLRWGAKAHRKRRDAGRRLTDRSNFDLRFPASVKFRTIRLSRAPSLAYSARVQTFLGAA